MHEAIIDSGCSIKDYPNQCEEINFNPTLVTLSNSKTITSTKTVLLPKFMNMPAANRKAAILTSLRQGSLISAGKLCDANCEVKFNKNAVKAIKDNKTIIEGTRKKSNGLHYLDASDRQDNKNAPTYNNINNVLPQTTSEKLTRFVNAELYSPTKTTIMKETKKLFLATWPNIS